jgi:HTH-type transcriptional regulator/antitoxin HipB
MLKKSQAAKTSVEGVAIAARDPVYLGTALTRFRKSLSLSQQVLAERAGIKQSGVSSVESGALGTRLETVFKLLAALDLELVIRKRHKAPAADGAD